MRRYRGSLAVYRLLLHVYPRDFRLRFGRNLTADFTEMLEQSGRCAAWSRVLADLARSVPSTYSFASARERRLRAIAFRGETPMASLLFDLRQATRALVRTPVFTAVTVLTLALGIGANSAMFSLVNAVLLRPLGYERPERLMLIHEAIPESNIPRFGVSPPDYLDLTRLETPFSAIGAYRTRQFEMSGGAEPEQVAGAQVTPSVFQTLGVGPAIGRAFMPEEEAAPAAVAIISHSLWQRRFAGAGVLGTRITLDRQPFTVVGVMPPGFQFPKRGPQFNSEPADVWTPLWFNPFERQARGMFYNHSVIARLKEGVSVERAAADTAALAARVVENYPAATRSWSASLRLLATPLVGEISGQVRRPLLLLLGAVGLVLLVACSNVANLILSRAAAREREIGVRTALGAERYRLFQMLLTESVLLSLTAGGVGLAIAYWLLRALPSLVTTRLPGVTAIPLDLRVVSFTFGLAALTALLFSLIPLAAGARRTVSEMLREGGARSSSGRRHHRVQGTLVVSSIALAFVLLVSASLLLRSLNNLLTTDVGAGAPQVLTMNVILPPAGYGDPQRIRGFYTELQRRLESLPGARAAVVATDRPLQADSERRAFTPERRDDPTAAPATSIAVTWAYGNYFETFGIPVLRGRVFTPEEQAEDRQVAIVSARVAERFWPGDDPIGKRLKWGLPTSQDSWKTIVGVVGDVLEGPPGTEPVIHAYVPYAEIPDQALSSPLAGLVRRMRIAVRTDGDAAALAAPARQTIASLDPALAVTRVATMEEVKADATGPQRFTATVITAFAGGALALAGIGLYGVLAFGVSQRTREIGVRLALGARRGEVIALVMRQGMLLVAIGLALGGAAATAAARLMRALLYETNAADPWLIAGVLAVLAGVALAACVVPAHRASRVEPMTALRAD